MKTLHIAGRALWRREGDAIVVLDEVSGEPYLMEGTAAAVFLAMVDGPTPEALMERMREAFECEGSDLAADLEDFVSKMVKAGLVEVREVEK